MSTRGRHLVPVLLMALMGCAHGGGGGRGDVIVSMTRVSVAPQPESGERWDGGPAKGDNAGCRLIGALSAYVAPGTGAIASGVCVLVSKSRGGGDLKPEDPDLFVGFTLGQRTYRSPVIPNRHSHDRRFELFVPGRLLREGMRAAVYDLDGEFPSDTTLIADVTLGAAALRDGVEVKDTRLEMLRLHARPAPRRDEARRLVISAADGLVPVDGLDVPAGMLVEIRARGRYQIGSWNDSTLGPAGYPGGGPRGYNLPGDAFESAAHGAAVALLQRDSAVQELVVGECARFVAESGGRLLVGVNDRDHRNNSGDLTFEIRVSATDVDTWSRGLSERCG